MRSENLSAGVLLRGAAAVVEGWRVGPARARPWCAPALRARGVVCPDRPAVVLRQENSENLGAFTSSELPGGQHGPGPGGLPPVALQTDDYGDGGGSAKKASATTHVTLVSSV